MKKMIIIKSLKKKNKLKRIKSFINNKINWVIKFLEKQTLSYFLLLPLFVKKIILFYIYKVIKKMEILFYNNINKIKSYSYFSSFFNFIQSYLYFMLLFLRNYYYYYFYI